jgi:AraC-like DNA-binding protein
MRYANDGSRVPLAFLAAENDFPVRHNGTEIRSDHLVLCRNDVGRTWTETASDIATMSLPVAELAVATEAVLGRPFSLPKDTTVYRIPGATMSCLRKLHEATVQLANAAPSIIMKSAVAKAMEHELVQAMIGCLGGAAEVQSMRSSRPHSQVIARFEDFLASRRGEPLYLAEICAAIGVSQRTLHSCCHEHYGVGPMRYLWLRRMNLAHRALLRTEAAKSTVTEIATDHGFWELGRFSVDYRTLFGQTPSATLQQPVQEDPRRMAWH